MKSDPKLDPHHQPLPYVVVLRGAMGPDEAPQTWEEHVTAYSVYEALLQAMLQVGGQMSIEDSSKMRFTVERVGPDIKEYWRQITKNLFASRKSEQ